MKKYWSSNVPKVDDFGDEITDVFIDGKSRQGPWGFFTPASYKQYGAYPERLGTGIGQKYQKQTDGKWLKIEG